MGEGKIRGIENIRKAIKKDGRSDVRDKTSLRPSHSHSCKNFLRKRTNGQLQRGKVRQKSMEGVMKRKVRRKVKAHVEGYGRGE